jgi:hypothetical protein
LPIFDQARYICPACFRALGLRFSHVRVVLDPSKRCVCSFFTPLTLTGRKAAGSPLGGIADYTLGTMVGAALTLLRSRESSPEAFDDIMDFLTDVAVASPAFAQQIAYLYIDQKTVPLIFAAWSVLECTKALRLVRFCQVIAKDDTARLWLVKFFCDHPSALFLIPTDRAGRHHLFAAICDLLSECWEYLSVKKRAGVLRIRVGTLVQAMLPLSIDAPVEHDFFRDFELFFASKDVVELWTHSPAFQTVFTELLPNEFVEPADYPAGLRLQRKIAGMLEQWVTGRVDWRNLSMLLHDFLACWAVADRMDGGTFSVEIFRRSVCTKGVYVGCAAVLHAFLLENFVFHTESPAAVWGMDNPMSLMVIPFRICAFSAFVTLGVPCRPDCRVLIEEGDFRYNLAGAVHGRNLWNGTVATLELLYRNGAGDFRSRRRF